ncbi:MAG: hypothetical protein J7K00_01395 [Candidatus Diapherotrites archaeon]|nr:hypothetical protein [Candidatus Diapherotrites archaeon]
MKENDFAGKTKKPSVVARGFSTFTLDGIAALAISITAVVLIVVFLLGYVPTNTVTEKVYLQSYADFASKTLVESPGVPSNWESLSSVSVIGLADCLAPRVFSTSKSNALALLTQQQVKDAMQVGDLNVNLRITVTNDSNASFVLVETPSDTPPKSARESNRFMVNSGNELIRVKVQVWG